MNFVCLIDQLHACNHELCMTRSEKKSYCATNFVLMFSWEETVLVNFKSDITPLHRWCIFKYQLQIANAKITQKSPKLEYLGNLVVAMIMLRYLTFPKKIGQQSTQYLEHLRSSILFISR